MEKVALLLGKGVVGICNRVMENVGVHFVLVGPMVAEKEAIVWIGCCWILVLLSRVISLPP